MTSYPETKSNPHRNSDHQISRSDESPNRCAKIFRPNFPRNDLPKTGHVVITLGQQIDHFYLSVPLMLSSPCHRSGDEIWLKVRDD